LIKLRVLHNRLAKRNVHVMHVARNIETELKLDRYTNVVRFLLALPCFTDMALHAIG